MREKMLVESDTTLDGVAGLKLLLPVGAFEVVNSLAQLLLWVLQGHLLHVVVVALLNPAHVRGNAS